MSTIRIEYFEAKSDEDDKAKYEVELAEGESIVSIERHLDGGYNTNWYRVFIEAT